MKYAITLLASLLFMFTLTAQDTIPNAGFERWEQVTTWYEEPVSWETNNSQIVTTVTKDTAAYEGDYSMKLVTGGEAFSKFLFSKIPLYGTAYVKTNIPSVDTVKINLIFYINGSPLTGGEWKTNETLDTFTQVMIPISGVLGFRPDSAKIEIIGGRNIAGFQSEFWIDELDFEFPLGVKEQLKVENLNVFPNPASKQINVEYEKIGKLPEKLNIIDISGRIVKTVDVVQNPVSISLSGLPAGKYEIIGTIDGKPAMSGSFVRVN